MNEHHEDRNRWIRRLIARGVPPGDVARVLGVGKRAINEALYHRRKTWAVTPEAEADIRRLRAEGLTLRAIGKAVGLPHQKVDDVLRGVRPHVPRGPTVAQGAPRGPSAGKVRRLAQLGYDNDRIADLLGIDAGDVADLVNRIGPDGRIVRRTIRREWGWSIGPEWRDDGPMIGIASDAGELHQVEPIEPAIAAAEASPPAPSGDWGPVTGGKVGARSNNASLSDAEADRVRELRARGVSRADVAREMGVSVATVSRITGGKSYGPVVVAGDDAVTIPDPPPIAEANGPPPAAWAEPRRPGRRLPREYRDD